jgi:hypothetical protein
VFFLKGGKCIVIKEGDFEREYTLKRIELSRTLHGNKKCFIQFIYKVSDRSTMAEVMEYDIIKCR